MILSKYGKHGNQTWFRNGIHSLLRRANALIILPFCANLAVAYCFGPPATPFSFQFVERESYSAANIVSNSI